MELVKKLLAKGADANARTAKAAAGGRGGGGGGLFRQIAGEQTPLLVAAKANRPEAMRALVAGGADPKLKARDGTTLLMAAAGNGHVEAEAYRFAGEEYSLLMKFSVRPVSGPAIGNSLVTKKTPTSIAKPRSFDFVSGDRPAVLISCGFCWR